MLKTGSMMMASIILVMASIIAIVGAEVSRCQKIFVTKMDLWGKKEVANSMQNITCGHCRYCFLFKHEFVKKSKQKIKKLNIHKGRICHCKLR